MGFLPFCEFRLSPWDYLTPGQNALRQTPSRFVTGETKRARSRTIFLDAGLHGASFKAATRQRMRDIFARTPSTGPEVA
jgi:hypothetical protein